MNFEEFKYHYWNVFIDYISTFYPLSIETIEKYRYDLNWRALSSNRSLPWNSDFIEKHKENLTWHILATNPKVPITANFVRECDKRLDWFYLSRNPSLPLTDEFIETNKKKFIVDEDHPAITEDFKSRYSEKIIPRQIEPPKPDGIQYCSLDDFEENYGKWKQQCYPEIYERIIEPNIQDGQIEQILNSIIPQPGKYVYLSPAQVDRFGVITSFDPLPRDAISGDLVESYKENIEFEQNSLQGGKDRIYSIVNIRTQRHPCLLLSNSLYEHLSTHNLTRHVKLKAQLKASKLIVNEEYWLLIFEDNSLLLECKDQQEFEFYFKRFSEVGRKRVVVGDKSDFEKLKKLTYEEHRPTIGSILEFYPKSVQVKSNIDLFTLNRKIIVSGRLRDSMLTNGFGPINFNSPSPLMLTSDRSDDQVFEGQNQQANKITVRSENYYDLKKSRLIENDPPSKRVIVFPDRFSLIEKKLNVIFPNQFKKAYSKSKILFDHGSWTEEFDWLPINDIFIERGYSDRYPESFKSCVVGEDGGGNYVALLLRKDHDYKLSTIYVMFNHESGEMLVEKLRITDTTS